MNHQLIRLPKSGIPLTKSQQGNQITISYRDGEDKIEMFSGAKEQFDELIKAIRSFLDEIEGSGFEPTKRRRQC